MSVTLTGLGKYQKGLEMEAEGLSGKEIAKKLGYKDAESWYGAKAYYGKKEALLNNRAAADAAPEETKPHPWTEACRKQSAKEDTELAGTLAQSAKQAEHLTTLAGLMATEKIKTGLMNAALTEDAQTAAQDARSITDAALNAAEDVIMGDIAEPAQETAEPEHQPPQIHYHVYASGDAFRYTLCDNEQVQILRHDGTAKLEMTLDEFFQMVSETLELMQAVKP